MALEPAALTDAIDQAFGIEWAKAKPGTPLPDAGAADRRLLFAAVARGLLQYFSDKEATIVSHMTLTPDGADTATGYAVSDTDLAITVD